MKSAAVYRFALQFNPFAPDVSKLGSEKAENFTPEVVVVKKGFYLFFEFFFYEWMKVYFVHGMVNNFILFKYQ